MSLGLISAGAPASHTAPSPGTAQAKADASKTDNSSGKAAEETVHDRGAKPRSFGELVDRRDADIPTRHNPRPEVEFAPHRGKAKEHSPWRPFDLMKPQGTADRDEGAGATETGEETEAGTDAMLAFVLPSQAAAIATEKAQGAAGDGRQGPPPAAFGLARVDGDANRAKEPTQRQAAATSHEKRVATDAGTRSAPQVVAAPEAGEVRAGQRGEPFLSEQARAVRATPAASTAALAARGEPKVTLLSTHVSPALAPSSAPGFSITGAAFVEAMKSDGALPQHLAAARVLPDALQPSSTKPVTTLKLQLHPAELGAVTVKLTGSGEQLAIEVRVENAEARHRLSSDSESIVKALRGMGFEIDRITVQQAPSPSSTPGGASNRENGFGAQEGRSGERQEQPARQEAGQRHEQNARGKGGDIGDRSEGPGGSVYI